MCVDIGKCGVHSVNMMRWMEGSGVRGWQFVVWAGGFRMTVLGLIEDELGMGDFWWWIRNRECDRNSDFNINVVVDINNSRFTSVPEAIHCRKGRREVHVANFAERRASHDKGAVYIPISSMGALGPHSVPIGRDMNRSKAGLY